MCSAANKTLAAMAVALAASMAACGDSAASKERAGAEGLLAEIKAEAAAGNYARAHELTDSLNSAYPGQIECRREVTAMLPSIIEGLTMQQIAVADSVREAVMAEYAELLPKMRFIGGEDKEYYVVDAYAQAGNMQNNAIEARVRDEYPAFYVVARNNGKPVGLNAVALVGADGSEFASQAVPEGNDRAMQVEGSELCVFLPEEVDEMGRMAYERGNVVSAVLIGPRGRVPVKLNAVQVGQFATAWHFADAARRMREADLNREKLERQLILSRRQAADQDNKQ